MLIEFSVTNFKSIKERQTLSLAAKKENTHTYATGFKKVPFLLKRIAILGPNASGKSNIVEAIGVASQIIRKSYQFENDQPISVEPYLLDDTTAKQPSEFEFIFTHGDAVYQYGFEADRKEIHKEWLYVTPKEGNLQRWFERGSKEKKEEWYINPVLKGRRQEWIAETRPNTLLLSLLGTYKNHAMLKDVQGYFTKSLISWSMAEQVSSGFTTHACFNDEAMKKRVVGFLKSADLGISGLSISEEQFNMESIPKELPNEIREQIITDLKDKKFFSTKTLHTKENGKKIEFELEQESAGTQLLYCIAYPIISTLKQGGILIVDEISNSMHFKELEFIENIFYNPETNPHGAQIVFTTHDVSVLHRLHREELYFTDKLNGFHTQLYPLTDFENRGDSSIYNRYVSGLYFALPKIKADS